MKFKRRPFHLSPPYVSMADIAFNLVLFFLIMARVKSNDHIEWQAARVKGTEKVSKAAVTIATGYKKGEEGEGKFIRVFLDGQEVSVRDLAGQVERRLEGKEGPERAVLLKIHKDTLAATFEPIMEAVSQAGGEVVHVLEEEK